MVWPEDISLETLLILDTRGLPLHFRPARVQVLGSPLNQKEGQVRRGSKPEQEFNYQIRSDEYEGSPKPGWRQELQTQTRRWTCAEQQCLPGPIYRPRDRPALTATVPG